MTYEIFMGFRQPQIWKLPLPMSYPEISIHLFKKWEKMI